MFALLLSSRRRGEKIVFAYPAGGNDPSYSWFALSERAGLIQDEGRHLFQYLDCCGVFYENARLSAAANSDHNGHRGGQAESTRASDDQHRNCIHDGVRQAWLGTDPSPYDKSCQRCQ